MRKKKRLVNPGVKYPNSKLVKEALIKPRKKEHTYSTCACGNVDYKTLVYLAKNSIRVIDNLAKTLASMEEKFDETKKTVEYITNSASKQLDTKDAQINFLKDKLEEMGVRTNETEQ